MNHGAGKILVFGERGQLGRQLLATAPDLCTGADSADITNAQEVSDAISRVEPSAIINCAAYTAVDAAENEPERAFAVNRDGARLVAEAAREADVRCLHVSTDFVFDGTKAAPYLPGDPVSPLGVYGTSKAAGESEVSSANPDALILRTSWVYSVYRSNFVKTMLRLMQRKTPLKVVDDQTGAPTWTGSLAGVLLAAAQRPEPLTGLHHWSDAGETTWFGFACAIQEQAHAAGLLNETVEIMPVTTAEYGNQTPRPGYSTLADPSLGPELNMVQQPWGQQLGAMLAALGEIQN